MPHLRRRCLRSTITCAFLIYHRDEIFFIRITLKKRVNLCRERERTRCLDVLWHDIKPASSELSNAGFSRRNLDLQFPIRIAELLANLLLRNMLKANRWHWRLRLSISLCIMSSLARKLDIIRPATWGASNGIGKRFQRRFQLMVHIKVSLESHRATYEYDFRSNAPYTTCLVSRAKASLRSGFVWRQISINIWRWMLKLWRLKAMLFFMWHVLISRLDWQ